MYLWQLRTITCRWNSTAPWIRRFLPFFQLIHLLFTQLTLSIQNMLISTKCMKKEINKTKQKVFIYDVSAYKIYRSSKCMKWSCMHLWKRTFPESNDQIIWQGPFWVYFQLSWKCNLIQKHHMYLWFIDLFMICKSYKQ